MVERSLELQVDEVEALASIYGEEWCVIDEASRVFSIKITDGQEKPLLGVCLQVVLPPDYPVDAPPMYQLNAPWLRGDDRRQLASSLEDIYSANIGESIVFLWVEKIREFITEKAMTGLVHTGSPSVELQQHLTSETSFDTEDLDDNLELMSSPLRIAEQQSNFAGLSERLAGASCPEVYHGDPITDRRSTFQAHLAAVTDKNQVLLVLDKLKENKKVATATHNIVAYRIERGDVTFQGCDDDGETHAGSRMLHLLKLTNVSNVVVVVSRWYGGIQLGADRFKHINNCARNILQAHDYVTSNKIEKKEARAKVGRSK